MMTCLERIVVSPSLTPLTSPFSFTREVTSRNLMTSAPCRTASRMLASVRRNGSTDASGTFTAPMSAGFTAGSTFIASSGVIASASMPQSRQALMNFSWYSRLSSGRVMKSPPVGSMQDDAILRRIIFSDMHSLAPSGSVTAYLAPLWSKPWLWPEAPSQRSPLSTRRVLSPRSAQSLAVAAPVIPPPMIMTSYSLCESSINIISNLRIKREKL